MIFERCCPGKQIVTDAFGRFGWSFDEEYEDDASGDALDPAETNIYVDWQGAEDRVWSRYLKTTYDDTRTPRVGTEGTEEGRVPT